MDHIIRKELTEIKEYILNQVSLQKEILNFHEAATYLGMSKSSLYKITSARSIPIYKPAGKLIYFKRRELEEWLLKHRYASIEEINSQLLKPKKEK